jgi:GDP-L-fucose synthase
MKMTPDRRVYVAGHRGLVGSALLRGLTRRGYEHLLTRTHAELDLTDAAAVEAFFVAERPEFVLLAAAKVGGILANDSYPADFLRENLLIQTNVIEASRRAGVERLLFLGSSCIYPKLCPQPMREEYLLTGPLEPTNRPYALAKIAGVEMCWAYNRQYGTRYLAAMPTNLYGPGDSFDPMNSHVLPALLRKADAAARNGDATMTVWGSGTPRRELMHSDDMADACLFLMELEEEAYASLLGLDSEMRDAAPLVNVGVGEDLSIRELAELAARVTGFGGELVFDATKPDGTPRKLMDVSRLRELGWRPRIGLEEGVRAVYEGVREQLAQS